MKPVSLLYEAFSKILPPCVCLFIFESAHLTRGFLHAQKDPAHLEVERNVSSLQVLQTKRVHYLLVDAGHDSDVRDVDEDDVELGQQAGLRRVSIADDFITFTFLDEFKYGELLAFSQDWLSVSFRLW